MQDDRLNSTWWTLRLTYGLLPIIAGVDKFTNLLTNWEQYLSPLIANHISPGAFMRGVGVIEIIAGVLVLTKMTRVGAYVVSLWLAGIALNVLTTGHFLDVAVRDLVMGVGAFSLARLTEVREGRAVRSAAPGVALGA